MYKPHVVSITQDDMTLAAQRARAMGVLPKSFTKGEGNIAGFIGEIVTEKCCDFIKANTDNYDFVDRNGYTIEVKTKRTTSIPKGNWLSSVSAHRKIQQTCDILLFVRAYQVEKRDNLPFIKAWIMGYMPRHEFYHKSFFAKKGDPDPDSPGWGGFREDCWNIKSEELLQF